MANQTGRPIAPARKLVAAVMGTLAVFVIVFGLGMSSMAVAFFGVAVLALAIILALVPMSGRRGGRATVAGNAEIKSIPPPPLSSAYGRAEIEAIVVAPGLGTFETVIRESRVPVAKWPPVGATVPITVDVDDTRRVRVNWNDAPTRDEGADPPPPPPPAADYAPPEEIDDDVLGVDDPAPWEGRDRDWAFDSEPPPPPPPAYASSRTTTPVVVRDTPTGTIVEGQLVDADAEPAPLPRRAPGATRFDRASGPSAEATAAEEADPDDPAFDPPPPGAAMPAPAPEGVAEAAPENAPEPAADDDADPASGHSAGGSRASGPGHSSAGASVPGAGSEYHGGSASGPAGSPSGYQAAGTPGSTTGYHAADTPHTATYSDPGTPETDQPGAPGPSGFTAAYMAGGTPRTSSTRPPGSRPSPKRRGSTATATAERQDPAEDSAAAPGRTPTQRTPADSHTSADPVIDVPLDEPTRPAPSADATTAWAPTGATSQGTPAPRAGDTDTISRPAAAPQHSSDPDAVTQPIGGSAAPAPTEATPTTTSGRTRFFTQPNDPTDRIPTQTGPRPEPTATSAPAEPSPVTAPPTAPEPDRPFPSAPPPSTPRPAGPADDAADIDIPLGTEPPHEPGATDPIDIPLDSSPEPAPETTSGAASAAMADGIIAPPAEAIPPTQPQPEGADSRAAAAAAAGAAVGAAAARSGGSPSDDTANMTESDKAAPRPTGSPWGDFGKTEPDEHIADVITAYPSARPGPAGAIHGVGITVLVTDLDRSIAFYRDILGFFEIDSGDGSAVLASGDTRLVLRTVHNLAAEAGRLIYLNLEVGDVEAVHDELRAKGVKFVHSPRSVNRGDKLELWSATFRDPDNHNIAITQWRAIR